MIHVCSLAEMPLLAAELKPSHVISLLGDDPFPATPESVAAGGHLKLHMHDIVEPLPGCIAPGADHLGELVDFIDGWQQGGRLIIHCYAGVSRSTAAALMVLARYNRGREAEAAELLRRRAPHAHPNRRMIALADPLLACEGRLAAAVEAMGAPDFMAPLQAVSLPAKLG